MKYVIESSKTQQFNLAIQHEWLETNGLGGFASSTIIGTNTRRYHGLLVASLKPPVERTVMLSKMDETIWAYGRRHDLGCNKYNGAIYPTGYIFLQKFQKGLFPEFIYRVNGIEIKKTIASINGENTTIILYDVLKAEEKFQMELLPLSHPRDFHKLQPGESIPKHEVTFNNGILNYRSADIYPNLYISVPGARYEGHKEWYYQFEYLEELNRGQDGYEDLFSLGNLFTELGEGDQLGIIVSIDDPSGRDAFELFEQERNRRMELIKHNCTHPLKKSLMLAADQFIVKRDENLKSIIAGYPWFTDWGRDTMIALPGLCLTTGRHEDAKKILQAFADNLSEGMIPNRFSDYQEEPEYNTVDATLWFFIALYHYQQYTGDDTFIAEQMLPRLEEIIHYHRQGTRYNIKVDEEDGLISAGYPGIQLTWMDAKAGDWIVTPREGKAVEINALWYNALCIFAFFKDKYGRHEEAKAISQQAEEMRIRFEEIFWNEEKGCMYDLVNDQGKDDAIRPNQLFSISLPFPLIDRTKARRLLDVVSQDLYTPVGLRSLAPSDDQYKRVYNGDQVSRDGAYHQGIVWSWLLGPYIDAHMYVMGDYGVYYAEEVFKNMAPHLKEAGIGSISEIFDSEEPFIPRGCIAQAWSVAELLRVMNQYKLFRLAQPSLQEDNKIIQKATKSNKLPIVMY